MDLIGDPIERQLARYLQCAGPTAPRELIAAFGLSPRTASRKLTRLRARGICEVIGSTRGARYQLRAITLQIEIAVGTKAVRYYYQHIV